MLCHKSVQAAFEQAQAFRHFLQHIEITFLLPVICRWYLHWNAVLLMLSEPPFWVDVCIHLQLTVEE
jgi:hypothetical protein